MTGRDPGLQAERTTLAWTRTSLGLLANGALLLIRDFYSDAGTLGVAAIVVAAVLAVFTYLIGMRRQRTLARNPLPDRLSPRREVYLLGLSVAALVVMSVLAVL